VVKIFKLVKNVVVYGLAIYGAMTLLKGCGNEANSYQIHNINKTERIEFIIDQPSKSINEKAKPLLLERRIESVYLKR
jgi:hypothetical protein